MPTKAGYSPPLDQPENQIAGLELGELYEIDHQVLRSKLEENIHIRQATMVDGFIWPFVRPVAQRISLRIANSIR